MRMKNLLTAALTFIALLKPGSAFAQTNAPLTIEDTLPKLYEFAAPLSQVQFEFFMNPILLFLKDECKRTVPSSVLADQKDACVLEESWSRLQDLSNTLKNPEVSPLQLSNLLANPHLDQVAAGAWTENFMASPPKNQAAVSVTFAADIMLTKIIVQKALSAYARWAVFISKDPDNVAKTYLVPKLIQSLEGKSLLGGLFQRYQQQTCSLKQIMESPGSSLCQIEKGRLATVINTLYKSNADDIEEVVRMTSVLNKEGNRDSARQLAFLDPLQDTLRKINSDSEPVIKTWADLKSNTSAKRDLIEMQFVKLTHFAISLNSETTVQTYIFLSALLSLKDVVQIKAHLESQQSAAAEVVPQTLTNPSLKKLNEKSRMEISTMTSVVQEFLSQSAEGEF